MLADKPHTTRSELTQNSLLTENGVKKIIAKMKDAGWIERKGSNKNGYWVVNYDLSELS